MTRIGSVVGVLAASLLLFVEAPAAPPRLALVAGDPAPDMRGQTPDDQYFAMQYKPAKATVLNFWATWCVPCREEMTRLDELYRRRAADGLQVAGVHAGFVEKAVLGEYLQVVPVTYSIVLPESRYLDAWGGVAVLPMTFLVDGEGKILRRYIGAAPEQIQGLLADIEAVLDGRPLGPVIVPEEPVVATDPSSNSDGRK